MAPPGPSTAPDEDAQELAMVVAARAGDEEALGQLMRRCLPVARGLALRSGCRPEDVEDVVQDATAEAVAWLPRLRQPEAFRTWFGQIVIYVTRAYQRRERLRRRLGIVTAGSAGLAIERVAATTPTPERLAEMRELSNSLDPLPERILEAIRLRHLDGLELEEVADVLGVSRSSVKRDLAVAQEALSRRLDEPVSAGGLRPRKGAIRRGLALLTVWPWFLGGKEARAAGPLISRLTFLAGLTTFTLALWQGRSVDDDRDAVVEAAAVAPLPALFVAPGPAAQSGGASGPPRASFAAPSRPIDPRGVSVDVFLDRLGINVRLGQDPQPFALVQARLAELGLRHVIDVAESRLDWLGRLGQQGIRTNLFLAPETEAHAQVAPHVSFVEAVTFRQERGDMPHGLWAERQRAWMEESYTRLKADPRTRGVAVVGATMSDDEKRGALGDVSAWVDFAASGAPSGRLPPGGAFMDATLAVYWPVYGDRPVIVPQVSHSTHDGPDGIDERTQAKYVLRSYLETFRRGVARVYGAYLFDRTPQPRRYNDGMGLVRRDGTRKPAFEALVRLLELAAAPASSPLPPGELPELRDEELEQLTLIRRDGSRLMVLWLAVAATGQDVSAVVQARGITAGHLHDLSSGAVTRVGGEAEEVTLTVTDMPMVLELGPALPVRDVVSER